MFGELIINENNFLLALTGISVSSSVHANYLWFLFEPKNDVFRDIDVTYDDYTVSVTTSMPSSMHVSQ